MSCETTWPTSVTVEIPLPSNLVNLFNFFIFDILLISLVFYFTTEISGRLNYLSLSDGRPQKLEIQCPPIVGGGLCSTSRPRMWAMLFIRCVAFLLIFASNLAIDGFTRDSIVTRMGTKRVSGPIDSMDGKEHKRLLQITSSCQVTSGDFRYFGEVRENDFCEYRLELLDKPISVSLDLRRMDLETRECNFTEEKSTGILRKQFYRCSNARLRCTMAEGFRRDPQFCEGFIEDKGTTYICSPFVIIAGNIWTGQCRIIRNFEVTNEYWFNAFEHFVTSLVNEIGVASIAREENRTLRYLGKKIPVTQVHHAWFILFSAKLCLVLALAGFTAYLIWTGARCVVHDERSLASLLSATVSRNSTVEQDTSKVYLNAATRLNRTIFWVSRFPHRRRANLERHNLEEAAIRSG